MNASRISPAVCPVVVVIPVFHRPRTVLDALESVLGQTARPRRALVVDDGSTDDTGSSVEAWIARRDATDLVQLLRGSHGGAARARNLGLAAAGDAPYVAFLDSDDLWPEDFLERTSLALSEDPTAIEASCDRERTSASRGVVVDSLAALAQDATAWLFEQDAGVLSCSLLRTDAVRALGGFPDDLRTGHDTALLLPLSTRGPWRHCPGAPVTFRRGVARERGEHDHIRRGHADYKRQWALVLERFVSEQGGTAVLPAALVRRELARRWSQAARQLLRAGRLPEARACFKRSAAWQPHPKTLLRLGLAHLRRGRSRGRP